VPRYANTATTIADGIVVVLPPLVEDTKSGPQTASNRTASHSYHTDLFLPPHEQER
jgi:hypothetical protein